MTDFGTKVYCEQCGKLMTSIFGDVYADLRGSKLTLFCSGECRVIWLVDNGHMVDRKA